MLTSKKQHIVQRFKRNLLKPLGSRYYDIPTECPKNFGLTQLILRKQPSSRMERLHYCKM
ncbi:hypothetical protein Hanom_Chr09g00836581 [Helianthus anomalus]